jgi:hypothetical protein
MGKDGLDHPVIGERLQELDAALSTLPADEAVGLRKQIIAHLDEASGNAGSTAQPPVTFATLARARLARVRKRTWITSVLVVVLLGVGTGYLVNYLAVGNLQLTGGGGWWFPQDYTHETNTTADGAMQTTVPIRDGQEQGFAVGIYNPTGWTQTVLGPTPGEGSPGSQSLMVGVSVFNREINFGGFIRDVRFILPASIPPHQIRLLRLLWISDVCLEGGGGEEGTDDVSLRVRIGWFSRTETIPLGQGWYVAGPSRGRCG